MVGGARPAHPHNHLAQSRQVMPPAQVNDVSVPDHGSVAHPDEVFLATAGYDHTVKFWQAHTGQCTRTIQHSDSQVNCLEISPDGQLLAACGFQHIRMYDISAGGAGAGVGGGAAAAAGSGAVVNYEGVRKNVMDVGFQDAGRWIYTGGEDGTVKIWDPRARNLECQRSYSAGAPVNAVRLLPNQMELVVGDQAGRVHLWNLRTDRGEQFTPQPTASIQSVAINSLGRWNEKVVSFIIK